MNTTLTAEFTAQLTSELRSFLQLCEEALALAISENQALAGSPDYQVREFSERRKNMLPGLDRAITHIRQCRGIWMQADPEERNANEELKSLFQAVQGVLMKVLLLDRENQQAMLRRGLVPTQHLPPAAAQRPHFVTGLYKRNSNL